MNHLSNEKPRNETIWNCTADTSVVEMWRFPAPAAVQCAGSQVRLHLSPGYWIMFRSDSCASPIMVAGSAAHATVTLKKNLSVWDRTTKEMWSGIEKPGSGGRFWQREECDTSCFHRSFCYFSVPLVCVYLHFNHLIITRINTNEVISFSLYRSLFSSFFYLFIQANYSTLIKMEMRPS